MPIPKSADELREALAIIAELLPGVVAFHNNEWGGEYMCGVCDAVGYKPERLEHKACVVTRAQEFLASHPFPEGKDAST